MGMEALSGVLLIVILLSAVVVFFFWLLLFFIAKRFPGYKALATAALAIFIFLLIAFAYFALLISISRRPTANELAAKCLSNVKQLNLALLQYTNDWDGRFPPASRWSDAIRPYIGKKDIFICPARPKIRCGYAYNKNLSNARMEDLEGDETQIVTIFESDHGGNASGGRDLMPSQPRHRGDEDVFGLADGHVAVLSRDRQSDLRWEAKQ